MRAANAAGPRSPRSLPLPSPMEAAIRGGARFGLGGQNGVNTAAPNTANGGLNQPPLTSAGSTSSTASSSGYSSINNDQHNNTTSHQKQTNGHSTPDFSTKSISPNKINRVPVPSISSGSNSTTSSTSGRSQGGAVSPGGRVCQFHDFFTPLSPFCTIIYSIPFDRF